MRIDPRELRDIGIMVAMAGAALLALIHYAHAGERSFSGIASSYGKESGPATASGVPFDENKLTAAHRSLPFGTVLLCRRGERSVRVTVNDRGPFIKGRVIDFSTAAARVLRMIDIGIAPVSCEVVG